VHLEVSVRNVRLGCMAASCRPNIGHAEYPAFSVGENISPDTPGHMAIGSYLCGLLLPRPEAANQNRCLPARFK
jgi:hypothetical protein